MTLNPEDLAVLTEVGNLEHFDPAYWIPFATEWEKWENTTAKFNPIASTDSSVPASTFNSDGVREYTSVADGALATVRTLDPGSHYTQYTDYYAHVRQAVQLKSIDAAGRGIVEAEIRKWGTTGFANVIASGWNPVAQTPVPVAPTVPTLDDFNAALQKRFAIHRLADDADLSKVEQGWGLLKGANLV